MELFYIATFTGLASLVVLVVKGWLGSPTARLRAPSRALGLPLAEDGRSYRGNLLGRNVRIDLGPKGALQVHVEVPAVQWLVAEADRFHGQTGDAAFDQRLSVDWLNTEPRALSAAVREGLVDLTTYGQLEADGGWLQLQLPGTPGVDHVGRVVHEMIRVAALVDGSPDHVDLVGDRAEPAELRLRALRVAPLPTDDARVRELMTSDLLPVRLAAACAQGDDDRLLALLAAGDLDGAQRERAFAALSPGAHDRWVAAQLDEGPAAWPAAMERTEARPSGRVVTAWVEWWDRVGADAREAVADAMVGLLAVHPVAGAVDVCLEALGHGLSRAEERQAVGVVADHVTVADLDGLRRARSRSPRRVADQLEMIIDALHADIGAEPGQLSVVEASPAAGAVSVAAASGAMAISEGGPGSRRER